MINALIFFALLMILHYSLTILNINANALSLIFFINANTLIIMYHVSDNFGKNRKTFFVLPVKDFIVIVFDNLH